MDKPDKKQLKQKKVAVLIELPQAYIEKLDKRAAADNRKRKSMTEVIVMQQLDAANTAAG